MKIKEIVSKVKEVISKIINIIGDKKFHLMCGFIVTLIIGFISLLAGIFAGCVAALTKELYDQIEYKKNGTGEGFNKYDLLYSLAGVLIAVIILLII